MLYIPATVCLFGHLSVRAHCSLQNGKLPKVKLRGQVIHVRSNWQNSFEIKRSKVKVIDVESGGPHVAAVIEAALACCLL